MSDLGPWLGSHVREPGQADQRAARAAMGIPEGAAVIPMDLSRSPLFVMAIEGDEGLEIIARATMTKRDAARILREVADAWNAEAGEPE